MVCLGEEAGRASALVIAQVRINTSSAPASRAEVCANRPPDRTWEHAQIVGLPGSRLRMTGMKIETPATLAHVPCAYRTKSLTPSTEPPAMLSTMAIQTSGPSARHSHTRSFQIRFTLEAYKDKRHTRQEHRRKGKRVDRGSPFRHRTRLASTLSSEPDQQYKSCNQRDANPTHQPSPRARTPPKMNSTMSAIKPKA